MALLNPCSRLSPLSADAVETLNDQESPLLRLPAELRKYVYKYACGDLIITLDTRYKNGDTYYYLSAREEHYEREVHDLHRLCGYIFACRKIYVEARLLLFQLNTFYIRSSSVPHLPRILHEAYRSVITSIRIDYDVLIFGDGVYNDEAALLGIFTKLELIIVPSRLPPWPRPDFPWPMLEEYLYITVERRIGGSCLRTKLEELRESDNEVFRGNDLEDMVSRLILNLGWTDLELIDIELMYD